MANSPYLNEPNRLAEVISAIQAMGNYKFYKLDFEGWADRISGEKNKAEHWKQIFIEHPEFFRLDAERMKASLVWRRNYQKLYDIDGEKKLTREEFFQLSEEQRKRISRNPLTNADINTLINAAINLHSRALEHQKDTRWWLTILMSAGVGGMISVLGLVVGRLL
ncbi:N-carbamoyl-L-amino acid amidohydrolase [Nitrospira sp. Ecomares 2.1]